MITIFIIDDKPGLMTITVQRGV